MITKNEVEHVAMLARLELTEEEKEKYTVQFSKILEYFNQLKEADTENIEPMIHVMSLRNFMREDHVEFASNKNDILKNAPLEEDGYFRVPKI